MLDRTHDHGMIGRGDVVADEQFLKELFRTSQTGINDLDVSVWMSGITHGQARQVDHASGEIIDADGSSHVEDEHIPTLRHRARLNDQLGSLRDGHEIANDLRMRHCYGTAAAYLFTEQGDHRARGS